MPLIVFGDGLADKSSVRFRSFRHGVPEKAYKHLLVKQKIGEVFATSVRPKTQDISEIPMTDLSIQY
ncbi:hypothetical protein J3Q64DRAFT_1829435 [Phycomyces blakesleeanus]|uniref:Uncharacterized protein n=1 Tax=Phycomyces blakesleeanus TaxID=4837 RepID=A0ABR3BKN4_PHYBL